MLNDVVDIEFVGVVYSFFSKSIDTPHGPPASRNSQFAEHAQAEALGPEVADVKQL